MRAVRGPRRRDLVGLAEAGVAPRLVGAGRRPGPASGPLRARPAGTGREDVPVRRRPPRGSRARRGGRGKRKPLETRAASPSPGGVPPARRPGDGSVRPGPGRGPVGPARGPGVPRCPALKWAPGRFPVTGGSPGSGPAVRHSAGSRSAVSAVARPRARCLLRGTGAALGGGGGAGGDQQPRTGWEGALGRPWQHRLP